MSILQQQFVYFGLMMFFLGRPSKHMKCMGSLYAKLVLNTHLHASPKTLLISLKFDMYLIKALSALLAESVQSFLAAVFSISTSIIREKCETVFPL